MPYVNIHDSGLQSAGIMAGNIGLYDTGQQQFSNQLRANADQRAQDAADQSLGSGQDSAYRTIIGDITNRQLSANRLQEQTSLQGMRADEQVQLQALRQAAASNQLNDAGIQRLQYLDTKDKFIAAQNSQKQDVQQGEFWNGTIPQRYAATDAANTRSNNSINAAGQRQQNSFDFRAEHPANGPGDMARAWSQDQRQWEQRKQTLEFQIRQIQSQMRAYQIANFGKTDPNMLEQFSQLQEAYKAHIAQQPAPPTPQGNQVDPTYYDSVQNMSPDTSPGAIYPQGEQPQSMAPQQSDPAAVISQLAQQIVQEMPTASHAAMKTELMVRVQQQGINPAQLGVA